MNPIRFLFPLLSAAIQIASLTDTAQTVVAVGAATLITWGIINGGAADEVVIFRAVDNTPEYFRVTVPSGSSVIVPGFTVDPLQGLEIITVDAAADIDCTFFPWTA